MYLLIWVLWATGLYEVHRGNVIDGKLDFLMALLIAIVWNMTKKREVKP